jgi:hypothetical protein
MQKEDNIDLEVFQSSRSIKIITSSFSFVCCCEVQELIVSTLPTLTSLRGNVHLVLHTPNEPLIQVDFSTDPCLRMKVLGDFVAASLQLA